MMEDGYHQTMPATAMFLQSAPTASMCTPPLTHTVIFKLSEYGAAQGELATLTVLRQTAHSVSDALSSRAIDTIEKLRFACECL